MTDKTLTAEELQPGKKYKIHLWDCCVGADFVGTFVERRYSEYEPDFLNGLVFDIGIVDNGGQYTEVEES